MKYEMTGEKRVYRGRILYHIRALRDIPCFDINAGDVGGWIENENNLAQDGDAWIAGNAVVFGDACVYDNARVHDNTRVHDNAHLLERATILDHAEVSGDAKIFDGTQVRGIAEGYGHVPGCRFITTSNMAYVMPKEIMAAGNGGSRDI